VLLQVVEKLTERGVPEEIAFPIGEAVYDSHSDAITAHGLGHLLIHAPGLDHAVALRVLHELRAVGD
jgi:hypothetical protein